MPNALRGHVDLPIGPHVFSLTPSFNVLATLEDEIGRSIFAILHDFSSPRTTKVSEIAKVIFIASGKKVPYAEIGMMLQDHGLNGVLNPLLDFLTKAITTEKGLKEAEDKRKSTEDVPAPLAP